MSKVKLGAISEIKAGPFGTQLHKHDYVTSGEIMINAKNIGNGSLILDSIDYISPKKYDELNQYILKEGDIVFGRAGSIDKHVYIDKKGEGFFQGTNCIRVRLNNLTLAKYISYYLWLPIVKKQIANNSGGSVLSYLNTDILKEVKIPTTDESKMKKIVSMLDILERKIELNNKINAELEAMAKTIYDYWFLQFDFPNEEGKPYRSSGGKMVWNEQLKREIPKGWKAQSIAKNSLSKLIKPGVNTFEVKTYLATADVNGTSFGDGNLIEFRTRENRANMQPSINSVWFAKIKNSIKHLFLNEAMSELIESTILSTGFCGMQCTETSFEYIASYISSSQFEITKDMLAHGATQQAVNNSDLLFIKIAIPEDRILKLYHEATKSIFDKISNNRNENQQLVKLRDWLLPMLMNGQVTVEEKVSEN